jgi:hypothetical protein
MYTSQKLVSQISAVATGALLSLATASPAQAVAIGTLNFSGGCTSDCGIDGPNGKVRYFSATASDGSVVQVRATAWSIFDGNWDAGTHRESFLGHYSGGLGVTSPWITNGDQDGSSNRHTTDNVGSKDYVVLQFDQLVTPTSVKLNAFSIYGDKGWTTDNDATVLIGNTGIGWNQYLDPSAIFDNLSTDLHRIDVRTNPGTPTVGIDAGGNFGNVIIVAADLFYGGASGDYPDAFKLGALTFAGMEVPEPATLGLFGLGLFGIAAARRRTR